MADSLSGTLSAGIKLGGTLASEGKIGGTLSEGGKLSGTLKAENKLSGSLVMASRPIDDIYQGESTVIPSADPQILSTKNKTLYQDIVVAEIPTYETSNEYGTSFIIAS